MEFWWKCLLISFLQKISPSSWQIFYYKYDPSSVDRGIPFLYIHLMGLSVSCALKTCALKTRDSRVFHLRFQQRCASFVPLWESTLFHCIIFSDWKSLCLMKFWDVEKIKKRGVNKIKRNLNLHVETVSLKVDIWMFLWSETFRINSEIGKTILMDI